MPLMLSTLFHALRAAGVEDAIATAAAEELAQSHRRNGVDLQLDLYQALDTRLARIETLLVVLTRQNECLKAGTVTLLVLTLALVGLVFLKGAP